MPLKVQRDEQPTLNLTPMIDIVFLLIIFFMVGTKFTELEQNIPVQVPKVRQLAPQQTPPRRRIVAIHRDGRIQLDATFVTLAELQQELQAARESKSLLGVVVRGDADSPFQRVASVLNACRQAGIEQMGISVRLASRMEAP